MLEYLKESIKSLITSRLFIVFLFFAFLMCTLIHRVFTLQIVNGENYMDTFQLKIEKERKLVGTRGIIYDRNGVPLAYNKLAYSVTIEDNGTYASTKEKNKTLNASIYDLIGIIEKYGGNIDQDFNITLDDNGNYSFTVEDTKKMRFLADVYGRKSIDDLKPVEGTSTAETVIDYLCSPSKYGLYDSDLYKKDPTLAKEQCPYSSDEKLKIITIRYAMDQNRFQKYLLTTFATNVNEQTVAAIKENMDNLQGIDISEDTIRVYTDSKYFSNILGYTGKASSEEIEELQKVNEEYAASDIIGKSGLEQYLETTLRGTNGSEKLFVNNTGKTIEVSERIEPTAGNDVYLSIDADYQKAAYTILEQKIAGILYSKIENTNSYVAGEDSTASDIMIPITDVYFALIDNNVININHFSEEDASDTEQTIYSKFLQRQESVLASLEELLLNSSALPYKDSSSENKEYMSYIVNSFLTSDRAIIDSSLVDRKDKTYIAWTTEETINIKSYLQYALSRGWMNMTGIESEDSYMDSDEAYAQLVDYIVTNLADDKEFNKIVYKYMIKNRTITGNEISLVLFDQGVLSYDEESINNLRAGAVDGYYFIKSKIQNLEITPAQLALDPCSGSLTVIDPNDGSLLALVSYPGYDNNRLANTMDSEYYASLNSDKSSPFYNHATQEKTAPGSTFKIVSSIAGLQENVITTSEQIEDLGIYEKITPSSPRCWIYTQAHVTHGSLNVSGAIENSCNYFFYEVGYRLGCANRNESTYNSSKGLSVLQGYADMFGLEEKTGLEIPEAAGQFSTQDAVRSAIGQGTHAYTTIELGRYCAAIANSGTVYNMTLIDKITDSEGNLIEDNSPTVYNEIDVPGNVWNAVHEGMKAVVNANKSFNEMPIQAAGKTGTAQQSSNRPNHALFIGYAPYDDPQIAIACRIPFGYTSSNAAEVSRDVMKYVLNLQDKSEILSGTASEAGAAGGD